MLPAADFSATATDYARYRPGYPPELFRRLAGWNVGETGQRIADLGAGTGAFARGLAKRGSLVTGVDRSEALLAEARRLDAAEGLRIEYVLAPAEATGLSTGAFEVVTAAQCWHWFDRPRAAAEACRLLAPGGRLCITHCDWVPLRGNVVEATESLIEAHNPAQPKPHIRFAHGQGLYPDWLRDVAEAGFVGIETWTFDLTLPYSHDAWRGRVRASQGVGATLGPDAVRRFDDELAAVLEKRFPGELTIPYRCFAVLADAPR